MKRNNILWSLTLWCLASMASADNYLSQEAFLSQAFGEQPAAAKTLWLKPEHKEAATALLGHSYVGLRVRYWQADTTSAWILQEIGKEKPITIGVVITDNQIQSVAVLAFLESRGWEVRYPFFTDQFTGARLDKSQQLSQHIDGITGATLSVRAVTNVARLALYLAEQTGVSHNQAATQP
ncbi:MULTISPECIES: FMN-binding protein [unclassified Oceanobacter]|uniref:FMN-binding protein n=1 Tax=unclassified Oceanobacter TaxID=2620260 RepID=UPI002736CD23|nr:MULTISPECIES: FMN-binding protein [unclassified Oceanobacter]MDP2505261.1 FMN-binding protein [Oceanobacter sp. 3_MG-2023]MDP2607914.1 FMN-binding protein [Oceanobacter sp. 1_MG-2023]MDP2611424.1 FMN-binding protein [Oceanobacter sp. 2_MG-2023]